MTELNMTNEEIVNLSEEEFKDYLETYQILVSDSNKSKLSKLTKIEEDYFNSLDYAEQRHIKQRVKEIRQRRLSELTRFKPSDVRHSKIFLNCHKCIYIKKYNSGGKPCPIVTDQGKIILYENRITCQFFQEVKDD